jgi:hypothetical protein
MGIMDIFRKKKLPPGDPRVQKIGLKAVNKNAEGATRYEAMGELAQIGTPEAVFCVLQRFTVVIGGPTPDEDEKNKARQIVVAAGRTAIDPLMRFIRENETVGLALETLKDITQSTNYLDLLLELTRSFDPYFSKYPDKKIHVFREIGTFVDPRIVDALKPFLDDDDDDIRMAVVSALAAQNDEESTRELLIQSILDSNERPRIRMAACDALSEKGWTVKGYRKQVESVLPDQYYLNKQGQIITK